MPYNQKLRATATILALTLAGLLIYVFAPLPNLIGRIIFAVVMPLIGCYLIMLLIAGLRVWMKRRILNQGEPKEEPKPKQ